MAALGFWGHVLQFCTLLAVLCMAQTSLSHHSSQVPVLWPSAAGSALPTQGRVEQEGDRGAGAAIEGLDEGWWMACGGGK